MSNCFEIVVALLHLLLRFHRGDVLTADGDIMEHKVLAAFVFFRWLGLPESMVIVLFVVWLHQLRLTQLAGETGYEWQTIHSSLPPEDSCRPVYYLCNTS